MLPENHLAAVMSLVVLNESFRYIDIQDFRIFYLKEVIRRPRFLATSLLMGIVVAVQQRAVSSPPSL